MRVVENEAARAFPAEGERAPTRAPPTTTGRAARLREGREEEGKGDGAVSSRSHEERRLETAWRGGGARTSRRLRTSNGAKGRVSSTRGDSDGLSGARGLTGEAIWRMRSRRSEGKEGEERGERARGLGALAADEEPSRAGLLEAWARAEIEQGIEQGGLVEERSSSLEPPSSTSSRVGLVDSPSSNSSRSTPVRASFELFSSNYIEPSLLELSSNTPRRPPPRSALRSA